MPDKGPSLENIVDDLTDILDDVRIEEDDGSVAHYDAIQQGLSEQLHLHILTYIRFLEDQGFLVYDRVTDTLNLADAGRDALGETDSWRAEVADAFSDQIVAPSEPAQETPIDDAPKDELPGNDAPEDELPESDAPDDDATDDIDEKLNHDLLNEIASGLDEVSADLDAQEQAKQAADQAESDLDAATDHTSAGEDVDLISDRVFDGPGPASTPQATDADAATNDDTFNNQRPNAQRDVMNQSGQPQGTQTPGSVTTSSNAAELYKRVDELGVGGVGTVFKAQQVKLKRDVALKEVDQVFNVFAGVKRADIVASFTEVVQRQASLVHPNIVQVLDIETDAEFPYVVTQYAPRGNLRRLIEMPDRPTLSVALKYFMQILSALSTAHDNGIIHGNLKPENVVLDAAGNAMISDFGMANVVEREDANTAHVYVGVGTVAYMSPEQFQNPNSATEQSDIYSLGIMLYEMLTGKVPGRRSPMPSSFYPDIPRSLDDIFDKMSVDDPEDRFLNVQEILQDLYQADDVMSLLDNRSGILFMRDPIEFGELGGIELTPSNASEDAPMGGADFAPRAADPEDSEGNIVEDDSSDELENQLDEDSEIDEDIEGDDVLGKLDKYGDMFDEEEDA